MPQFQDGLLCSTSQEQAVMGEAQIPASRGAALFASGLREEQEEEREAEYRRGHDPRHGDI